MTLRFFQGLLLLISGAGCAAPLQASSSGGSAPVLTIAVLRKDMKSGALRPLGAGELLGAREEAVLELRSPQPAQVSAVLYSDAGMSEELMPDPESKRLDANQTCRVTVPRRAPPGVKETELRVYVAASAAPISATVQQLLHLPCALQGDRGDPKPDKPKDGQKEPSHGEDRRSGQPREREQRGGEPGTSACEAPAGLTAPVLLRGLILRSE